MRMAAGAIVAGLCALTPAAAQLRDRAADGKSVSSGAWVARDGARSPAAALSREEAKRGCTQDGMIHAEASPAVTRRVAAAISLRMAGTAIRGATRLTLPCGFALDRRSGWNLVLTDGHEYRRYAENNAFGFMPAFGFSGDTPRSARLSYQPIADDKLQDDACPPVATARLDRCTGFGNPVAFFAVSRGGRTQRLAHYLVTDGTLREEFAVADLRLPVAGLFFLPPPDAPGGTITLLLRDGTALYRTFVDVPRG